MGRPAGWMKQLTGRDAMRSPGAPALRREVERQFWVQIATGIPSERAAEAVGVSPAVGSRWFRHRGGMPLFMSKPVSGRYLSFAEREEIGLLRAQDVTVREIARRIGRSPSTVSRELMRNAATRGGKVGNEAGNEDGNEIDAADGSRPRLNPLVAVAMEYARTSIRAEEQAILGRSLQTCQTCAAPGRMRLFAWRRTLCDGCAVAHTQAYGEQEITMAERNQGTASGGHAGHHSDGPLDLSDPSSW